MRARLVLWAAAFVAALGIAAVLVARRSGDMTPTGDIAIIESYTIEALEGHLQVGPYSRFQWHHPGPIYFYWVAPFYAASGHVTAGLSVAALVLAVATIVAASVALLASGEAVSAIAVTAALTLLMLRASDLFTSAWNPHVVVLPLAVTVVLAAAAAAGRTWLLPVAAVTSSLAAQTHIGTLPVAFAVMGAAALAVVLQRKWKPFVCALVLAAALWTPTILEQMSAASGNLSALWVFFASGTAASQPVRAAFLWWAAMLAAIARPGFSAADGGLLRVHHSATMQTYAIAELALLGVAATVAIRNRRRFEAFLALFCLGSSIIALWSVTRIEGDVMGYEVLWIAGLGALNGAAIVSSFAGWFIQDANATRQFSAGVCAALLLVCAFNGFARLLDVRTRSLSPGPDTMAIHDAAVGIQDYLRREHVVRPLVDVDQNSWGLAAAVLLQLQKAGIAYAVDDDWLPMFTERARSAGNETVGLSIAGAERHELIHDRPGVTPVLQAGPIFVDSYRSTTKR